MPKVWCATIECKHNKGNQCRAKSINLSDGHIHTVHQEYKHIHHCRTYEMSDRAKELEKMVKEKFWRKGGKSDGN